MAVAGIKAPARWLRQMARDAERRHDQKMRRVFQRAADSYGGEVRLTAAEVRDLAALYPLDERLTDAHRRIELTEQWEQEDRERLHGRLDRHRARIQGL